ncbi:unnamed protein product [Ectocarpus sp. 12 AP-2014]
MRVSAVAPSSRMSHTPTDSPLPRLGLSISPARCSTETNCPAMMDYTEVIWRRKMPIHASRRNASTVLLGMSAPGVPSRVTPACEAPLEHTSADEDGATLETLDIDEGFWRATNESEIILACYNADACIWGQTGADSFCAPGCKGPYCAVCQTDYSPSLAHTCTPCSSSRRQGLMAATVMAVIVTFLAIVTISKFLLSTEVEERNVGCFHRRVLRAVPLQALKIIVVVWQILTQFADAANVTYPGVYQDFLSAIDVVNFDLGSVLAAGCVWSDMGFHDRLLVATIAPLVVVGFLAMTYGIAMRRNSAAGHHSAGDRSAANI